MSRVVTGRPRGRPRTKGYSTPLERVTDRRRRNARQNDEQRQLRLRQEREAQRNRRQNRLNAYRQQLVQDNNFVSPAYLLHLHQNISARRSLDKFTKTYCSAHLFLRDREVQKYSVGDMDKVCVHCSAKLVAEELSDNTATMCCHKRKFNLERFAF